MKRSPMKASTKPMRRGKTLERSIEAAKKIGQKENTLFTKLVRKPIKAKFKKRVSQEGYTQADEQAHKTKIAGFGCAVCWRLFGPHDPAEVELHHLRGGGWGKGNFRTLIPLCPEHHRGNTGVHGLGVKGFDKHYGFTQQDLLDWTIEKSQEI